MLLTEGRGNGEWGMGNGKWSLGTSSQQNTAAKRTAHKQKIQHPLMITFVFPIAYITQLRKYKKIKIYIKIKSKKLEQKVKKKTVSFENLFIFLVSDFCTKRFNFWLHQCWKWCLKFVDRFVFTGFVVCKIWNKKLILTTRQWRSKQKNKTKN